MSSSAAVIIPQYDRDVVCILIEGWNEETPEQRHASCVMHLARRVVVLIEDLDCDSGRRV